MMASWQRALAWLVGAPVVSFAVLICRSVFAEDLTVTTYYPAPRGVYKELRTTDDALLALEGGAVGVGTATP